MTLLRSFIKGFRKTIWWDIYELMPDLFIDFDNKRLYSEYVESMHYQEYVPDSWQGELVDFCSNGSLPQDEMFWIKMKLIIEAF